MATRRCSCWIEGCELYKEIHPKRLKGAGFQRKKPFQLPTMKFHGSTVDQRQETQLNGQPHHLPGQSKDLIDFTWLSCDLTDLLNSFCIDIIRTFDNYEGNPSVQKQWRVYFDNKFCLMHKPSTLQSMDVINSKITMAKRVHHVKPWTTRAKQNIILSSSTTAHPQCLDRMSIDTSI